MGGHVPPLPHDSEGDNFDALRPGFSGKVRCLATDPPYNTGNRDFLYNDRFIDKGNLWRHSKWLEFMLTQESRNLQKKQNLRTYLF